MESHSNFMSAPRSLLAMALIASVLAVPGTRGQDRRYEKQGALPSHLKPTLSPPRSPQEALSSFRIDERFQIELVASEPLIADPVAIEFDTQGRLWVVEMRGFMRDLKATDQFERSGSVAVLEDLNDDGLMDRRTTYLDGLVLPRALCLYRGGLLVAEHDKLWFTQDTNGDLKCDERVLVDAEYATKGSVEHRPNGLLIGLDNWIYSAMSEKCYRFHQEQWVIEATEERGQWGITQNDYGRLFYNFNWSQLHCDLAPPNALLQNPHFEPALSVNATVTLDQRVFPIRMNTAVNRGYRPGVLDEKGRLREFASACSPWVYRGGTFSKEFVGNAFVCAPCANTIKRNFVDDAGVSVSARNAYPDRDFLASTDERFRPVALSGGPDGALYVVDMYRGVVQQAEFMTTYLRNDSENRHLAQPIHLGRIYRIQEKVADPHAPIAWNDRTSSELVALLEHRHGWVRDRAQQRLIHLGDPSEEAALKTLAVKGSSVSAVHALWTLDGLGVDMFEVALKQTHHEHPGLIAAAFAVAAKQAELPGQRLSLQQRVRRSHRLSNVHAFHGAVALGRFENQKIVGILKEISDLYSEDALIREALLSSLRGRELSFIKEALASTAPEQAGAGMLMLIQGAAVCAVRGEKRDQIEELIALGQGPLELHSAIQEGIWQALSQRVEPLELSRDPNLADPRFAQVLSWPGHQPTKASRQKLRQLNRDERELVARGQTLYNSLCASCHGARGQGKTYFAPPLVDSEWVLGEPELLAKILLHGVEGPMTVKGTVYAPPDILPAMPPVGMMSNSDIAAVLTFIRRAWGNTADPVGPERVRRVRDLNAHRKTAWTAEELLSSLESAKKQ